jgi:hypothetical protein
MWSSRSAFQTLCNGATFLSLVARMERESKDDQVLRQRRCPRYTLGAPAVLIYQGAGDKPTVVLCQVRDLGRKGIGLLCREPVPLNIRAEVFVFVDGGQYKAKAQVMHCDAKGITFRVGCEFADE